jgi:hypothetical protein
LIWKGKESNSTIVLSFGGGGGAVLNQGLSWTYIFSQLKKVLVWLPTMHQQRRNDNPLNFQLKTK